LFCKLGRFVEDLDFGSLIHFAIERKFIVNFQEYNSNKTSKVTRNPQPKTPIKPVTYTEEEIAKHNREDDCWFILEGKVYDVTTFMDIHPGGKRALMNFAGKDASANIEFHSPIMMKQAKLFYVGNLEGYKQPSSCIIS